MGEYCKAGELGRTDIGGVEGGLEVRAVRIGQLVSSAVEFLCRCLAPSALLSDMRASRISIML